MSSALESARKFIYEAGEQEALEDNVSKAFERSHELLNDMENVLQKCRRFFEDDTNGPVATLLSLRSSFDVSIEDIDLLITDWGILARKHGVSPYLLPSCHRSLRIELDGNIERSILLPQALEAEERSLKHYEVASRQLSNARAQVCHDLSKAVSQRLPSLGMEAIFVSRLNKGIRKCSDTTTGILGVDSVDFLLVNKKQLKNYELFSVLDTNDEQHSLLDVMGSSGEKARVLLCLEASIPGSVGSCIADQNPNDTETIQESVYGDSVQPLVSVLYDEIDAHVGGRALVSMGKMLLEQTLSSSSSSSGFPKKRGQVISITHSASLAALADHHLVVRKVKQDATQISDVIEVSVTCVEGNERTKELARMASGDIAVDEAEQFAKALLRDRFKVEEDSGLHL
jgi:DNA repair ATPase RecN